MSIHFSLQAYSLFFFHIPVSRYCTVHLHYCPVETTRCFMQNFYYILPSNFFFFYLPLNSSAFWKPRHESTCLFLTFQSYKSCWLKWYCDNSLSNVLHYSKQQDSLPKIKTTNSTNQFRPSLDTITRARRPCATESSPQVSMKWLIMLRSTWHG